MTKSIDWGEHVFAALEAVPNDEGRITLYGHDDAKCKKIVGKTALNTSLVAYLARSTRSRSDFPDPWPCSCVDDIAVAMAALDKVLAEKIVPPAPTPADNLQARVEDVRQKSTYTVQPDPNFPVLGSTVGYDSVRGFLLGVNVATETFPFLKDLARKVQANPAMPLSEKQVAAASRCMTNQARSAPRTNTKGITVDICRIPQGRYAARNAGGGITFVRVDRPQDSKWLGWAFVKQVIGGQPDQKLCAQKPGTTYNGPYAELLQNILNDIPAAEALYGTELGVCARCNRTLTDATSRALGIGPECRKKV